MKPCYDCSGCRYGINFNRVAKQDRCEWCQEQYYEWIRGLTDKAVDAAWERFVP